MVEPLDVKGIRTAGLCGWAAGPVGS